jgi:hypothetical protein
MSRFSPTSHRRILSQSILSQSILSQQALETEQSDRTQQLHQARRVNQTQQFGFQLVAWLCLLASFSLLGMLTLDSINRKFPPQLPSTYFQTETQGANR